MLLNLFFSALLFTGFKLNKQEVNFLKEQRILADYLKTNWIYYLTAILFISIANVVQSYYPKVLGNFTDDLQQGGITRSLVIHTSLLLLSIGLALGVLAGLGQYIVMRLGRLFEFLARSTSLLWEISSP